jgi:proteasome lid subunit RPN8/RPN11
MADGAVIRIAAAALATARAAARAHYPEECCGFLLGRAAANGAREVRRAVGADNGSADNRARRYAIGPDAVRRAERAAAEDSLEVVGFFHSHPDHPAEPSRFDLDHAWPWYTYLIVPVSGGEPGVARAWHLDDDRARFLPAELLEE